MLSWLLVFVPCLQVVKVIQKLANTSHVRESYMKPLEPFVKAHNEELKVYNTDMQIILYRTVVKMAPWAVHLTLKSDAVKE